MATIRKHSRQGDAILTCLQGTKSHPTANWVYQQLKPSLPNLSLGTVYRNLNSLREAGLIQRVGTVDGFDRFDADTSEHCHFICTCCHEVTDLDLPEAVLAVRKLAAREISADDYVLELTFTGTCKNCKSKENI